MSYISYRPLHVEDFSLKHILLFETWPVFILSYISYRPLHVEDFSLKHILLFETCFCIYTGLCIYTGIAQLFGLL